MVLSSKAINKFFMTLGGANVILNLRKSNGVNKLVDESEYHNTFVVNADSQGYSFGEDDRPQRIIKAFFASSAAYLSKTKIADENKAVALILTDVTGNFKYGGYVEYHANTENPDEPGNWSYTTTFNEDDIKDLEATKEVKKLLYGDQAFISTFDKVGYDVAGLNFEQERFIYDGCLLTIDTILQVLDAELDAAGGSEITLEMPGYFIATGTTENGEKVFAIEPDANMRTVIKDDDMLNV